jgi:hypothetical protein
MAVKLLESLVLLGEAVVRDALVKVQRIGSNPATERTPVEQPPMRYPFARADYEPQTLLHPADDLGMDPARDRAGRSSSAWGVLASRSPARNPGRTILWMASPDAGKTGPAARSPGLTTAGRPGGTGPALRGRSQVCRAKPYAPVGGITPLSVVRSTRHTQTGRRWSIPAGGTSTASTRGKGAR